jgi:hypothetical protein
MNRHDRYRRLVARQAELKGQDVRSLEAHLLACSECRELAAGYDAQDAALRPLGQVYPPTGLRAAVLASVDQRPRARRGASWGKAGFSMGRPGGVWLTSALAVALLLAGGVGVTTLISNSSSPPHVARTQLALARKGYTVIPTHAHVLVGPQAARQVALAFFSGRVSAVTLARVENIRTPAFGNQGRLCWLVSIVPPGSPLVAPPGNTWLDAAAPSSALSPTGYIVVFVDAKRGNFVLASSADSA